MHILVLLYAVIKKFTARVSPVMMHFQRSKLSFSQVVDSGQWHLLGSVK